MKKIKEVCKLAGISKRTLQYYDDTGLLSAERSIGNERLYSDEALKKLMRILVYKKLGLSLDEIKSIIDIPEERQREMLSGHIENLMTEKKELSEIIEFAEYIIQQGIPEPYKCCENRNVVTYSDQIDLLKASVCKKEV